MMTNLHHSWAFVSLWIFVRLPVHKGAIIARHKRRQPKRTRVGVELIPKCLKCPGHFLTDWAMRTSWQTFLLEVLCWNWQCLLVVWVMPLWLYDWVLCVITLCKETLPQLFSFSYLPAHPMFSTLRSTQIVCPQHKPEIQVIHGSAFCFKCKSFITIHASVLRKVGFTSIQSKNTIGEREIVGDKSHWHKLALLILHRFTCIAKFWSSETCLMFFVNVHPVQAMISNFLQRTFACVEELAELEETCWIFDAGVSWSTCLFGERNFSNQFSFTNGSAVPVLHTLFPMLDVTHTKYYRTGRLVSAQCTKIPP